LPTVSGRLDILVNSAGVLALAPLDQFTLEDDRTGPSTSARCSWHRRQQLLPCRRAAGINIGSTNAQRMPFAGGAAYAMSKSALGDWSRD
jgi:3-oxoacyl-[acyl-carrier protein] reductase